MKEINWSSLDPGAVEDILAALLMRIRSGAYRVDGAGGDDGADVVRPTPAGPHIYEIKSFAARLTPKQKNQIKKSLTTAVKERSELVAWTLVLPLDRSPAEERWLKDLQAAHPKLPLSWIGLTDIGVELAQHPEIQRNFVPGSPAYLALEWIKTANEEAAGLTNGIPDALPRFAALSSLLDETDPDYRFTVTTSEAGQEISVYPRDPGATERNPITGSFTLRAPVDSGAAEQILANDKYGTGFALDGDYITDLHLKFPGGLGDLPEGYQLQSVAMTPNPPKPQHGVVIATSATGDSVRRSMTLTRGTKGRQGGHSIEITDITGHLRMSWIVEPDGQPADFGIGMSLAGAMPNDALDIIDFALAAAEAETIELRFAGTPSLMRLKTTDPELIAAAHFARNVVSLIDRMQVNCKTTFPLPVTTRDEEITGLAMLDATIAAGHMDMPWIDGPIRLAEDFVRPMVTNHLIPRITANYRLSRNLNLGGNEMTLPVDIEMRGLNLLVTNALALREALRQTPPPAALDVHLAMDGQSRWWMEVIETDDP